MEVHAEPRFWITNYQVIQSPEETLVRSGCFGCSVCKTCLAGKETAVQGGNEYCWPCFENVFGVKCVSCLKSITGFGNLTFILFNNKVWHHECFRCSICGNSLQGKQTVQVEESIYCKRCSGTEVFHSG